MADFRNLRTVDQIAESNPTFSPASLRWLIFNAQSNGFDAALVRVGRRVLIDEVALNGWLERQRVAARSAA